MTLRKTSLALGAAIVGVGVTSLADGASAQRSTGIAVSEGPQFTPALRSGRSREYSRAPQSSQNLPGVTSRPSNPDMRGSPSMGDRGMRGGRMNGGMGRR